MGSALYHLMIRFVDSEAVSAHDTAGWRAPICDHLVPRQAGRAIGRGEAPKGFPSDLVAGAERRLRAIDMALELGDLRSPPGNRLEALKGDRAGQYSIRINDQWRICFRW